MRALVLCVLVAVGCGKGDDAKVDPNAPAGTVLAAEGTVTATRDSHSKQRPLVANGHVFADDVVQTGANSSVRIELHHNKARLALDANKKRRLSDTVAWRAKRQSGGGAAPVDETAAAGTHGERSAVDTANTAMKPDSTRGPATTDDTRRPAPRRKPKPRPMPGKHSATDKDKAKDPVGGRDEPNHTPRTAKLTAKSGPARFAAAMRSALTARRTKTDACTKSHGAGRVTLVVELDDAGNSRVTVATATPPALGACIVNALKGARFHDVPAGSYRFSLQLKAR